MSSTPTPKPTETLVQEIEHGVAAGAKRIGLWLDPAHIILVIMLAFALLGGVYFFESKRADVAEAKAEVATQVLKVAQEAAASSAVQNAVQQEQSKAVEAAMAAANQQLITANSQLQNANKQLTNQLLTQQKTDATLPPSGQAQRWQQLVPQATVSVTPSGFSVDPVGGLATIQALEEIPVDRQTIANLTSEVSNDQKTIANDAVSLTAEKIAHASDVANDQKQLVASQDETKKVKDDFTVYKHKARKNIIKAFFIGVVVGVIGGHAAGI